jgi:hypothetical protein
MKQLPGALPQITREAGDVVRNDVRESSPPRDVDAITVALSICVDILRSLSEWAQRAPRLRISRVIHFQRDC